MQERTTMCKNNSRDSRFLGACGVLQECNSLIADCPAIGYYAYTDRYRALSEVRR